MRYNSLATILRALSYLPSVAHDCWCCIRTLFEFL